MNTVLSWDIEGRELAAVNTNERHNLRKRFVLAVICCFNITLTGGQSLNVTKHLRLTDRQCYIKQL